MDHQLSFASNQHPLYGLTEYHCWPLIGWKSSVTPDPSIKGKKAFTDTTALKTPSRLKGFPAPGKYGELELKKCIVRGDQTL